MIKLTNSEVKILKELYSAYNKQLEEFTLYKRMRLTFLKTRQILKKLADIKFIQEADMIISLTQDGEDWIVSLNKYSTTPRLSTWLEIPIDFQQTQLNLDSFYIPNIHLLDKKLRKDIIE